MVLKLHTHAIAPRARLVATICKELDVPYEIVNVEVYKGEQKTPAYREFQPFGQVPYLDDDGFILYESRAICRYIAKKYASENIRLVPDGSDPKEEALFEQAASIEMSNFEPFAAGITTEKIIKKHLGLPANEERLDELVKSLKANMDVYDVILGKQTYLAGDKITVVDLFHLPYGAVVEKVGYSDIFETRPNVARWWKDITSRASWQAVKESA
ncbi:glutathione S-transferase [Hygrophoropsis aurantiaca]|uniref:Glutathione S-transferase n=1 Tax=Hygrophoropsis aurantiaca TaxID=72124 RepID=A0ACB8AK16_9AGAM|nr:glutathione S-transferase [Hygrophoropsis aurantiaca]